MSKNHAGAGWVGQKGGDGGRYSLVGAFGPRRAASWGSLGSGGHWHCLPNLRTWEEIRNPKEGETRDLKRGADQGK